MKQNYRYSGVRNGLIIVDNDDGRTNYPSNFIGCTTYAYNKIIYCDTNGLLHNDNNKPCFINHDSEGYRVHGKIHREDGPAFIQYYFNRRGKGNDIRYVEWYLDNQQYLMSQYLELLDKDYNKTQADINKIAIKYRRYMK